MTVSELEAKIIVLESRISNLEQRLQIEIAPPKPSRTVHMNSPRLVNRGQAADFRKIMTKEEW